MRSSLLFFAAAVVAGGSSALAETPTAPGDKAAQAPTHKTVCSWEERTGSIMPTKVCRNVALSKKEQEARDRSKRDQEPVADTKSSGL
jgi:hypothetical protein